jgi:hypothetical protein
LVFLQQLPGQVILGFSRVLLLLVEHLQISISITFLGAACEIGIFLEEFRVDLD